MAAARLGALALLVFALLLGASFDGGSVVEVDREGKVVWSIKDLNNPIEVQRTESGTTLVADHAGAIAKEYDQQGNVVWEFEHGGTNSINRRLPNGDTLIGCKTKIKLVAPDKTVRWEISGLEHCYGLTAY